MITFAGENIIGRAGEKYYIFDKKGNVLSKPYDLIVNTNELIDKKLLKFETGETDYLMCINIRK